MITILKQSTKQQNGQRLPNADSGTAAVSMTTGNANDGQLMGRKLHCHNVLNKSQKFSCWMNDLLFRLVAKVIQKNTSLKLHSKST